MLHIQRKLERIQNVLTSVAPPERYAELYAAQQALVWVLDSETFKAPHDMLVTYSRGGSRDCLAGNDHSVFSDNPGLRAV
jgi:hypothetical protein